MSWSDDDATLIYDLPELIPDDPPIYAAAGSTEAPARAAQRLGGTHVVVAVFAALVGASAAVWSIEGHALGAPPSPEVLMDSMTELLPANVYARAAAVLPRRGAPPQPTRAPSSAPAALELPSLAAAGAAPALPAGVDALEPAGTAVPSAEPVEPVERAQPDRDRSPEHAASTLAAHRRSPRAAAPSRASRAARAPGVLRINSRPWSKIYVDGRPIGSTPQTAIELSPGRHRILLINEELELERRLSVKVRAGETITRSVELLQ